MRLIDLQSNVRELEEGNGTMMEQSNKELLIASYNREIKLLKWILEIND